MPRRAVVKTTAPENFRHLSDMWQCNRGRCNAMPKTSRRHEYRNEKPRRAKLDSLDVAAHWQLIDAHPGFGRTQSVRNAAADAFYVATRSGPTAASAWSQDTAAVGRLQNTAALCWLTTSSVPRSPDRGRHSVDIRDRPRSFVHSSVQPPPGSSLRLAGRVYRLVVKLD